MDLKEQVILLAEERGINLETFLEVPQPVSVETKVALDLLPLTMRALELKRPNPKMVRTIKGAFDDPHLRYTIPSSSIQALYGENPNFAFFYQLVKEPNADYQAIMIARMFSPTREKPDSGIKVVDQRYIIEVYHILSVPLVGDATRLIKRGQRSVAPQQPTYHEIADLARSHLNSTI